MLKLIDTGVNLTHASFQNKLAQLTEEAKNAGVLHQIITGTCLTSSELALSLAQTDPSYFSCTVGCHPHDAKDFKTNDIDKLRSLSSHPEVVAIGECGLDFNRNYSPQEIQIKVFEQQIDLAQQLNLPLFMHQRDAHKAFVEILTACDGQTTKGVIHCFTGDKTQLKQCLDLGLYVGITGWICDERRSSELQEAINYLPLDRLLIETDSPYLLPRTIRPKPKSRTNVPANLPWVVKQIAEILNVSEQCIAEATTKNANMIFSLNS